MCVYMYVCICMYVSLYHSLYIKVGTLQLELGYLGYISGDPLFSVLSDKLNTAIYGLNSTLYGLYVHPDTGKMSHEGIYIYIHIHRHTGLLQGWLLVVMYVLYMYIYIYIETIRTY